MCNFAVIVSSSCSTDETVVADSDTEIETATSAQEIVTLSKGDDIKYEKAEISLDDTSAAFDKKMKHEKMVASLDVASSRLEDMKCAKSETSLYDASSRLDTHATRFKEVSGSMTVRKDKVDDSEPRNSDVIYSQDLIVRDINISSRRNAATNSSVPDFKRFRKVRFCYLYSMLTRSLFI